MNLKKLINDVLIEKLLGGPVEAPPAPPTEKPTTNPDRKTDKPPRRNPALPGPGHNPDTKGVEKKPKKKKVSMHEDDRFLAKRKHLIRK